MDKKDEEESEKHGQMFVQKKDLESKPLFYSSGRKRNIRHTRHRPPVRICTCHRCMETLNEVHQLAKEYRNKQAETFSLSTPHSEGSSPDSGRATGFFVEELLGQSAEFDEIILRIYEFEVPNTLVGLIIGIEGQTIRELSARANVRMVIRPYHTADKYETHQICSVQGGRAEINMCLHMIRLRYPPCRFPALNLKPVLPPTSPKITTFAAATIPGVPTALTLPLEIPCEVYISAHVDVGHFFLQLPTHPSFHSLAMLDQRMLSAYSKQQPAETSAERLPKPCNVGILCAAPASKGRWYRAITLAYDQEKDETLVRFVDYGGFARLPRAELRQIRTEFMTLPMQAIECHLAHVQPIDSTWSEKANELFQQLCVSKASLVGYSKNDDHDGMMIARVELLVLDENKKTVRFDQILLERGLAKPADPNSIVKTFH